MDDKQFLDEETQLPPLPTLTPKQAAFCEEYLVDFSAAAAAVRAGYSPRSAYTDGPRLLTYAQVRARVDELKAERSRRTGITADRVLQELARIAFVDASQVLDVEDGSIVPAAGADDRAAIQAVRVKRTTTKTGETVEREVRLHDKIRALEQLCKHLGISEGSIAAGQDDTGVVEIPAVDGQGDGAQTDAECTRGEGQ